MDGVATERERTRIMRKNNMIRDQLECISRTCNQLFLQTVPQQKEGNALWQARPQTIASSVGRCRIQRPANTALTCGSAELRDLTLGACRDRRFGQLLLYIDALMQWILESPDSVFTHMSRNTLASSGLAFHAIVEYLKFVPSIRRNLLTRQKTCGSRCLRRNSAPG